MIYLKKNAELALNNNHWLIHWKNIVLSFTW